MSIAKIKVEKVEKPATSAITKPRLRPVRIVPGEMDLRSEKFAELICSGINLRHSFLGAGYGKTTADRGMQSINRNMIAAIGRRGYKFAEIGRVMNPQDRGDFVRGQLLIKAMSGDETGLKALKMIGEDKEVAIFQPEGSVQVANISVPQAWLDRYKPELPTENDE